MAKYSGSWAEEVTVVLGSLLARNKNVVILDVSSVLVKLILEIRTEFNLMLHNFLELYHIIFIVISIQVYSVVESVLAVDLLSQENGNHRSHVSLRQILLQENLAREVEESKESRVS